MTEIVAAGAAAAARCCLEGDARVGNLLQLGRNTRARTRSWAPRDRLRTMNSRALPSLIRWSTCSTSGSALDHRGDLVGDRLGLLERGAGHHLDGQLGGVLVGVGWNSIGSVISSVTVSPSAPTPTHDHPEAVIAKRARKRPSRYRANPRSRRRSPRRAAPMSSADQRGSDDAATSWRACQRCPPARRRRAPAPPSARSVGRAERQHARAAIRPSRTTAAPAPV